MSLSSLFWRFVRFRDRRTSLTLAPPQQLTEKSNDCILPKDFEKEHNIFKQLDSLLNAGDMSRTADPTSELSNNFLANLLGHTLAAVLINILYYSRFTPTVRKVVCL